MAPSVLVRSPPRPSTCFSNSTARRIAPVTRSRSAPSNCDDVRLSDLEPQFVCQACAARAAPTMPARIGGMRALNRHHVREFNPKRKSPHWGRRKLKRDQ